MEIKDDIKEHGFSIVEGLEIDSDANKTLENFVKLFAQPMCYFDQPLVMDVKPQKGFQDVSYAGTGYFGLHTDLSFYPEPPKYIAMLCLSNDSEGGESLLADGKEIIKELSTEDLQILKSTNITFPSPDHVKGEPVVAPVLTHSNGNYLIRFRIDLLELDSTGLLEKFYNIAKAKTREFTLEPGSVLVIDNHRMLHGRNKITKDINSKRHFKRMYGEEINN